MMNKDETNHDQIINSDRASLAKKEKDESAFKFKGIVILISNIFFCSSV